MIDEIRNHGAPDAGRAGNIRDDKKAGPSKGSAAGDSASSGRSVAPELRNRLAGVAGDLEGLLKDLSKLQSQFRAAGDLASGLQELRKQGGSALARQLQARAEAAGLDIGPIEAGPEGIEKADGRLEAALSTLTGRRDTLETSIAKTQIALQNILSAGEGAELPTPPAVPPGHDLDPRHILQLLDRE